MTLMRLSSMGTVSADAACARPFLADPPRVGRTPAAAPFCKHLFVPNFTPAKLNYLKITTENEGSLRSAYEARTEQELPVLVRWFPQELSPAPTVAKFLDIILYSREQIRKEAAAMGRTDDADEPWGIISVKAQDVRAHPATPARCTRVAVNRCHPPFPARTSLPQVDYELPMQPITMMRNALGVDEGGSGVPLERAAYQASVAFWAEHAPLK